MNPVGLSDYDFQLFKSLLLRANTEHQLPKLKEAVDKEITKRTRKKILCEY